jgi:aquaporin Z
MKVTFSSYLDEYLGTFLFLLIIFASNGNPLIVGGGLALIIYLIANVSGGFVNPAISLAMYMNGTISVRDLFGYVFVQLLGGASAYYAYQMSKRI